MIYIAKFIAKSDLLKLLFTHLSHRWQITINTIITFIFIAFLTSWISFICDIFKPKYSSFDEFIPAIYLISTLFTTFLVIFIKRRSNLHNLICEVKYTFNTYISMINIYDSVFDKYRLLVQRSFFVPQSINFIKLYDLIVLNTVLIKLFSLYFNNKDIVEEENTVIKTELLQKLFKDKDFVNFYGNILLNIKGEDNENLIRIIVVDALMQSLFSKVWFKNYYEPVKINIMIDFIIGQWYSSFVSTTLNSNKKE